MSEIKIKLLRAKNYFSLLTFICFVQLICFSVVIAQDDPPPEAAPPPLKIISKDEKKILDSENDIKKRVKISLEMMDARLLKAEKLKVDESFKESLDELAGFHALVDNTLSYLFTKDNGSDKVDKRFMTLEIYLRKQIPRLEIIRREIPSKYSYHVGKLMKAVREARAKAVEPLFSDSVIREKKPNEN